MKKLYLCFIALIIISANPYLCHAAYQTDSLTLTGLKNKAVVATDANGKLIEGAAPDLSAYYKLDGSNANGYLYLGSGMYLKAIDANTTGAYIHDTLVFHWEDIPVTPAAGTPIGLLLCLTYS